MSAWKRRSGLLAVAVATVSFTSSGILAQPAKNKAVTAQTANDEEFARLVAEWTTRPDFISPLVDHLPKVAGIPNPKDILGHYIGEPKKLTYYADILRYYRALAAKSPRVRQIRDNVIVSITPTADPDGRDRNVDWYYKYGINETEGHPTGASVPYWGKYVFHDDNRDINYSQVSMRALLDWYLQWHPPIMHDLHQAQTLLYTFSGQPPQNPTLDPILYGELPAMANFEMSQMTKYGMPGVWTHGFVDMWSPGYLAFMSSNHNGMIRMYEIQGFSGANTQKMRLGNPNGSGANGAGGASDAPPPAGQGGAVAAGAG